MKYHCPKCQRVLYNRRLKRCGFCGASFCGASIPEKLRFTSEETAAIERKMAELEASRKEREPAEEVPCAAAQAQPAMVAVP